MSTCTVCEKSKATLNCACCLVETCKSCTQFIEEDTFSFMAKLPKELSGLAYCLNCFAEKVAPAMDAYAQTMEQAKEILVFTKSQGKETRLISRKELPVKVSDCADYDETILRLAFFATQAGFNAIIDVDIRSEKVKTNGYQSTRWFGTAVPANYESRHEVKDRSIWQNPN